LDWCLIASGWSDPSLWLAGLEVAIGVGFVIFVHELGHFVVAKMCGVKCEKFMIGFDIGGIRLLSFRRGETLYGIGILPLGGYVKMLGQEDNPAALRREMERARQEATEKPADAAAGANAEEESVEAKLYNPRSYLAKSVPQRMAIISAGVIMNMIFAFIFAVGAYLYGVKDSPSIVGGVWAGGAAWQADIRADDKIEEVAGHKVRTFQQMTREVVNGDVEHGIPLLIQRPGAAAMEVTVKPQELGGRPTIGVLGPRELELPKEKDSLVCLPGSAAEEAVPAFQHGDRFVKVDNQPVESYGQLQDLLASRADQPLVLTIARAKSAGDKVEKDEKAASKEEVQIKVPTNPMKHFGLAMQIGPVMTVQAGSPAAKADIQPSDVLKTVAGKPVADPMRLPDEFRKFAGKEVALGVEHNGKTRDVKVKLSSTARNCPSQLQDTPVAVTELGAAYFVLNTVANVEPDSPAAKAGLQPGDRLTQVKVIAPPAEQLQEMRKKYHDNELGQKDITLPFADKERNWPFFMLEMQSVLPGTTFEFTWQRDGKETTGKAVASLAAKDWFNPERGWETDAMLRTQQASGLADAVRMGWRETADSTLFVYRMLHSVSTNKISARNVSGPLGIVYAAMAIARSGLGNFLAFLTLLSANLAVLNFLPIPVLDGGHMALLLYEGVRGKPADERVQEVMTWIGLILLLTLMVWAFGLDLGFFSRPGAH
jgi:regulator of sigma E protease